MEKLKNDIAKENYRVAIKRKQATQIENTE